MVNTVIFTDQLPAEKQAEGLAVHQAIMSGACNKCDCLARCCSDSTFEFPKDAFCTAEKERILKKWRNDNGV